MSVEEVRARAEAQLMAIAGVKGVGVGNQRIIVYVESPEVAYNIPSTVEGFPVMPVVTGRIRPL